jgi:hypothetical protein
MPSIIDEGFDIPLAKRQKVTASSQPAKQQYGSRIFSPFRVGTSTQVAQGELANFAVDLGPSLTYLSTFYFRSLGKINLSNNNIGRKISTDI